METENKTLESENKTLQIQIPGVDLILKEVKEVKEMVVSINPANNDPIYVPKTHMFEKYDLSTSTLRNHEESGDLIVYKFGNKSFYQMQNIHDILEKGRIRRLNKRLNKRK